jgi:hypothetical protein
MMMARTYSRWIGLVVAVLVIFILLFCGLEIDKVRAQTESKQPKAAKEYIDLINWSWGYEMYGYQGSIAVNLRKQTASSMDQAEKKSASSSN